MNVAVYIRWSTEDQGEGTTLEVQLEACKHYVASQGWVFDADLVFVDDGYSGGSLDRPALTRLRRAVSARQVQCVVVYKLDRLSRSVVDTVNLVLEEWDDLCHVKSAREAIDTTSHAGKMFFYTLVSYAEWERSVIRERTASGRVRRAHEGRWAAGKPPYGYAIGEDKRLVVDPAEAPMVCRVFREYLAGVGSGRIASGLNADAVSFRGKVWRGGAVKRLLASPVYCGDLVFGVTRVNPKWKKRPGEGRNKKADEPYVRIEGGAPALVSREEWNACQAQRRDRDPVRGKRGGRAFSSPYLLSALAKCVRCGYSLIGLHGNRPGKSSVYQCRGQRDYGSSVCDCGMVRTAVLDGEVVAALKERYGTALAKEQYMTGLLRDVDTGLAAVRHSKVGLEKSLAKLEGELSHVRRLLRSQEISAQEYREMVADIESERSSERESLAALAVKEEGLLAQAGSGERMRAMLDSIDSFERLSVEQQKHLLGQFIASLRVYKPKGRSELQVEIVWKIPDASRPDEYTERDLA